MKAIAVVLGLSLLALSQADHHDLYEHAGETGAILKKVLDKYDHFARPKTADRAPTSVSMTISVLEAFWKDQELVLKVIFKRQWVDERLKFEVAPGGRDRIHLPIRDFGNRIWRPNTFFVYAYDVDDLNNKGLIKIMSNGTIEDKRIETIRIFKPLSTPDQKTIDGSFTLADFRYDNTRLTMNWPATHDKACMIVNDQHRVHISNIQCSKSTKKVLYGGEYDQMIATFTYTRP
uniref:Neurotransmitter-gated ion-channel ligand-binding domain-containing protein n=1 Tax=Romanomermis culicivorax TaxID=13658 RepID=A0A915IVM3_ROMCU